MNAQTTLNSAIANGFDRLSYRDVLLCILQGAGSGGGGGSSTGTITGSGSPVGAVTPTAIGQLYVDTATPALWASTGLTNTSWTIQFI